MIGTLKKIFAFAGGRKNLLKKSLFFSLLNGIFTSFQFGALYFIVDALACCHDFICALPDGYGIWHRAL